MKILVTGSTGFIGSQLCRALTAEGHAGARLPPPLQPAATYWKTWKWSTPWVT